MVSHCRRQEANKAALSRHYHRCRRLPASPLAMYFRCAGYSDEVNRMVAGGAKIGWETYAAVFQMTPSRQDALGWPAGRCRAGTASLSPPSRSIALHDSPPPSLPSTKARPSVVMVFLPPGPATKFIKTLKESGYTGAVASLSINGIPAVIRASGDKSRGLARYRRVLPRPNDSTNLLAARIRRKVMKEAGKERINSRPISAFVVGKITVRRHSSAAGRNVNRVKRWSPR